MVVAVVLGRRAYDQPDSYMVLSLEWGHLVRGVKTRQVQLGDWWIEWHHTDMLVVGNVSDSVVVVVAVIVLGNCSGSNN